MEEEETKTKDGRMCDPLGSQRFRVTTRGPSWAQKTKNQQTNQTKRKPNQRNKQTQRDQDGGRNDAHKTVGGVAAP